MIKKIIGKKPKIYEEPIKTKEEILPLLPEKFQQEIDKIVKYLKENDAKRIYLFGSLYEDNYNENSDIDIAVKGLQPEIILSCSRHMCFRF